MQDQIIVGLAQEWPAAEETSEQKRCLHQLTEMTDGDSHYYLMQFQSQSYSDNVKPLLCHPIGEMADWLSMPLIKETRHQME